MEALFIICISGFTQNRGYFHGIMRLKEKLYENGFGDTSRSRIIYLDWKSNFKKVAEEISLVCIYHGYKPRVVIAGYSYGGWGSLQLAKRLSKHAIGVDKMILSDPVGRPWWLPRPLPAVTSLLGRKYAFALKVPHNVSEVHSFYQTVNRPQGHELVSDNGTIIHEPIEVQKTHQKMDDLNLFHNRVIKEASQLWEDT